MNTAAPGVDVDIDTLLRRLWMQRMAGESDDDARAAVAASLALSPRGSGGYIRTLCYIAGADCDDILWVDREDVVVVVVGAVDDLAELQRQIDREVHCGLRVIATTDRSKVDALIDEARKATRERAR